MDLYIYNILIHKNTHNTSFLVRFNRYFWQKHDHPLSIGEGRDAFYYIICSLCHTLWACIRFLVNVVPHISRRAWLATNEFTCKGVNVNSWCCSVEKSIEKVNAFPVTTYICSRLLQILVPIRGTEFSAYEETLLLPLWLQNMVKQELMYLHILSTIIDSWLSSDKVWILFFNGAPVFANSPKTVIVVSHKNVGKPKAQQNAHQSASKHAWFLFCSIIWTDRRCHSTCCNQIVLYSNKNKIEFSTCCIYVSKEYPLRRLNRKAIPIVLGTYTYQIGLCENVKENPW